MPFFKQGMSIMSKRANKRTLSIYDEYREAFEKSEFTDSEIEELRKPIILLAQTICEHVWGEKFY